MIAATSSAHANSVKTPLSQEEVEKRFFNFFINVCFSHSFHLEEWATENMGPSTMSNASDLFNDVPLLNKASSSLNNGGAIWSTVLDRNQLYVAKLSYNGCGIFNEIHFTDKNLKQHFLNFGLNYEKKTKNKFYIEDKVTEASKGNLYGFSEYLMVLGNAQSQNKIYIYMKIFSNEANKVVGRTRFYYFETAENFSLNNKDGRAFMDQIYSPFSGRPEMTDEQYDALIQKEAARRLGNYKQTKTRR